MSRTFKILMFLPVVFGCLIRICTADPRNWLRYFDNPVIVPGFGIGTSFSDPSVLYDEEETLWKMWATVGWDEVRGQRRYAIRYAESEDGVYWKIQEDLAFLPSDNFNDWDYTHVEMPSVVKIPSAPPDKRYMLFYAGANVTQKALAKGEPNYQIGLAFSSDGKKFNRLPASLSPHSKNGLLLTIKDFFVYVLGVEEGTLSDPEILIKDGIYHLWFTGKGFDSSGRLVASGIGFASTADGVQWKVSPQNPLSSLMRKDNPGRSAHCSVLWNEAQQVFEMWYDDDSGKELSQVGLGDPKNVIGYWHAVSKNGEDWTTEHQEGRDFVWDSFDPAETYGLTAGVEVVLQDNVYFFFYGAKGAKKVPSRWPSEDIMTINLATRGAPIQY